MLLRSFSVFVGVPPKALSHLPSRTRDAAFGRMGALQGAGRRRGLVVRTARVRAMQMLTAVFFRVWAPLVAILVILSLLVWRAVTLLLNVAGRHG